MKFKKLFASVLAIALAVTAIPATSAKADVIEGSAAFLNTEVYKTVLPTTASQKFYLDPQGLSQVGQTGKAALPTGNAGQVVGKTTMSAINLSSRAVKMDVKYVLDVDSADMKVVALADSGTAIKDEADTVTKPAICLTVTAKNTNATKAVTAAAATLAVGGTDSVAAVASGTSFSAHAYEFEAADYQAVTKSAFDATDLDELYNSENYDYIMNTTGASIELEIGGICLAQGDYSAFTGANAKPLNLNMTFKFTKASDGSSLAPDLASLTLYSTSTTGYNNSNGVQYVLAAGATNVAYFINDTYYPADSYVFNDGTYIGLIWSPIYKSGDTCYITFTLGGNNYKYKMW